MTQFTSRAQILSVDPKPYRLFVDDVFRERTAYALPEHHDSAGFLISSRFAPREKFTVPPGGVIEGEDGRRRRRLDVNTILVELRDTIGREGGAARWYEAFFRAVSGVESLDRSFIDDVVQSGSIDERTHARKVLQRLCEGARARRAW